MQPFSGYLRPDLRTSLMNMSLVQRLPRKIHLYGSSSNVPRLPTLLKMLHTFCSLLARCRIPCACHAKRHLNVQKWSVHLSFFHFWLRNVLSATTACTFSTSQLPKVVRAYCVLCILTWKCASCHNGVHFFDISPSKRAPTLRCFVHSDFHMCFAPQRRALFRHRNFQKWSGVGVLWTSKCDSRHNGVQLFISHLTAWLRTRCFSEPTFRPSGATNHWKNTVNCGFCTSSRTCIFFLLRLSLFDLLSFSLSFSLLSDSSHLCFSTCPKCRKFDF